MNPEPLRAGRGDSKWGGTGVPELRMSLKDICAQANDPRWERAVLLTNPYQPDNPVVFANNAFLRQTGYRRHEVLGRNPRFLQGAGTDPVSVMAIRYALQNLLTIDLDILNYRKNGWPFWNRLRIRPILDALGQLEAYSSLQVVIRAEEAQGSPVMELPARHPAKTAASKRRGATTSSDVVPFLAMVEPDLAAPRRAGETFSDWRAEPFRQGTGTRRS